MATLDDNSIDSIVCDPPYELGFMGKAWDNSGIAYDVTVWQQCLRVLKPGGHLVAFGGSRTYHRLAVAIEDAGFEIRDQIQWIYGSGFPKSHNLKDEWQGWGTALKPAHEPAVLARKPLCGTVADNVMTWGVGALNIDGTRIATEDNLNGGSYGGVFSGSRDEHGNLPKAIGSGSKGRWPANVILDEDAAKALDGQSGVLNVGPKKVAFKNKPEMVYDGGWSEGEHRGYGDKGGASRFFYTAKASKAEREAGLYYEEWHVIAERDKNGNILTSDWRDDSRSSSGGYENKPTQPRANHHPTVKPLSLMRYLVRLVTPKGGKVLDPFMGSGSTGCASILEGFDFVGIDITPEYVAIAQKRIDHYAVTSPLEGF
jgi:site-specific DNA-methyltransferase (adenine-specific)